MLTKSEILKRMSSGDIRISSSLENKMGPNSVDLHLSARLLTYAEVELDPRTTNRTIELEIPKKGLTLYPGILYIGSTVEYTETHNLVPCIEGRSSVGRLGLHIHVSAGFGDIGFCGSWTLELSCVQPVRVYPNMSICQIFYTMPTGNISSTYEGRYQHQSGPVESRYEK